MATNVFRTWTKSEQWEVPSGTLAGKVVIQNVDGRVGVTLTARDDATVSYTLPNGNTISNWAVGGVGNKPGCAQVALDGDFLLTVTGVTAGETTGTGAAGTAAGTAVYAIVSSGAVTGLTLTASGNTKIGVVAPDARIIGTTTPVSIGVDL